MDELYEKSLENETLICLKAKFIIVEVSFTCSFHYRNGPYILHREYSTGSFVKFLALRRYLNVKPLMSFSSHEQSIEF